jgi:predicted nuclease of restriction endonuclease-like (RecB) superfamily
MPYSWLYLQVSLPLCLDHNLSKQHRAKAESLIHTHCLEECITSELYSALAKSHSENYMARCRIKSHQIIVQQAARCVEGYTQVLLMEVRSIFDDVDIPIPL